MKMSKSAIFTLAHKIAHQTAAIAGSYRIAFSCALKDIYAGICTAEETLEDKAISAAKKAAQIDVDSTDRESVFDAYFACEAALTAIRAYEYEDRSIERVKQCGRLSALFAEKMDVISDAETALGITRKDRKAARAARQA